MPVARRRCGNTSLTSTSVAGEVMAMGMARHPTTTSRQVNDGKVLSTKKAG
ncbi:hypothetical protein D3C85_1817180 [compost metagenome]